MFGSGRFLVLLLVVVALAVVCSAQVPTPPKGWPPVWYTWVVTSVVKIGVDKPLYDKGQLIAFDSTNGWACRHNEADLINPTNTTPVDYCDYKGLFHWMMNDVTVNSTCAGTATIPGPLSPVTYPPDFLTSATFIGVDKVAQKSCNHWVATSVNIGGNNVQMDLWTGVDDGYPCQISLNDFTASTITTWAFDGFNIVIPQAAIDQCSAANILCTKSNWLCNAISTTAPATLSAALGWVCDPTHLDCSPINPGGSHYYPNTLLDHCNWAFNAYYLLHRTTQGNSACSFGGIAHLVPPNTTKTTIDMKHHNNHHQMKEELLGTWLPYDIVCSRV